MSPQSHHHETNPHFVRLRSQDQQLGAPSTPFTSPPYQPPRGHHHETSPHFVRAGGPSSPWTSPPYQPPAPPPRRSHHASAPSGRPGVRAPPPGQPHKPPSSRPFPLGPEEPAPPHQSAAPARPLLLSPSNEPHPPRRHRSKPPPPQSAKPMAPRNPDDSPPPRPRIPPPKRTNVITWSAAVCCAIFSVILILAGLIVLIVYLVYRPHSPYFDIATANLNAAYLDMGFLLNADLTIFANFTNPSKKGSVDYSYVTFELYHYNTLIATRYVEPFSVPKKMSMFVTVHMVSSQVRLPIAESLELQKQIANGPVLLNVRGTFHARSNLGRVFRYSYWIHSHCSISLNSPPAGILRGRRCNVKH